ncbi:hypothetical protein IAS59_004152 [Cryptococcus gattii]
MRPSFLLPCVNRGCSTDIPVVGPAGLSRKKICSRVKSKHYLLTDRCDCADCAWSWTDFYMDRHRTP